MVTRKEEIDKQITQLTLSNKCYDLIFRRVVFLINESGILNSSWDDVVFPKSLNRSRYKSLAKCCFSCTSWAQRNLKMEVAAPGVFASAS